MPTNGRLDGAKAIATASARSGLRQRRDRSSSFRSNRILPLGAGRQRSARREPRHRFVPREYRARAYEDRPFPIGSGQVITQPPLVARMAEAAEVRPEERVLEVGTGSGYGAAVLAELAGEVCTVERRERFLGPALRRFRELGYHSVRVTADGQQREELGPVRFVPLVGEDGWSPEEV